MQNDVLSLSLSLYISLSLFLSLSLFRCLPKRTPSSCFDLTHRETTQLAPFVGSSQDAGPRKVCPAVILGKLADRTIPP